MPPETSDDAAGAGTAMADAVEVRRLAAKAPTSPLAGPPGQPLHPLLVGIPIGAWVLSFVFDVAAHVANEELVYARAAFWLVGAGIVGALAAGTLGVLDLLAVPRGTVAWRTGVRHLVLSDVVLVLFVVSFLARRNDSLQAAGVPLLLLSVVALGLLAASAWLGVRLVFRYGVRVLDEDAQRAGYTLVGGAREAEGADEVDAEDGAGEDGAAEAAAAADPTA